VLRWAVYEPGKTHARSSAPDHRYYAMVKDRQDGKRAALSEARKILRQACHILAELGDDALAAAKTLTTTRSTAGIRRSARPGPRSHKNRSAGLRTAQRSHRPLADPRTAWHPTSAGLPRRGHSFRAKSRTERSALGCPPGGV
jgi:hypothetical protein